MAELEAARLQDHRGLRTEGVPSHKAVRLDGRMVVEETGHGSISHLFVGLDVHKDSIDIALAEASHDVPSAAPGNCSGSQRCRHQGAAPADQRGLPPAAAHLRWLATLALPHPAQQIIFQEYLHAVTRCI